MKPKSLAWLALVVGFFAFLAWTTLSAQNVKCHVCIEYKGQRNCATASHQSKTEAIRSAQNTACGPITSGMNDAIACDAQLPVEQDCSGS